MKLNVVYFHGYPAKKDKKRRDLRKKILEMATAPDVAPSVPSSGTPEELAHALQNIPQRDQSGTDLPPSVIFLHVTPIAGRVGGLGGILSKASGATARIFIILVSGGGLSRNAEPVQQAIEEARRQTFGGCTYWPYDFDTSAEELKRAWDRIQACFGSDRYPTFDQFHEAIHPPFESVRSKIVKQLIETAGIQAAEFQPDALRFIERWSKGETELPGFTREEVKKTAENIKNFAEAERLRARLRHHDLGNRLLQSLQSALRVTSQEVENPSSRDDLEQILDQWSDTHKDLRALLEKISHCSIRLATEPLERSIQTLNKILQRLKTNLDLKKVEIDQTCIQDAVVACNQVIHDLVPVNEP